jgi:protein transport protein SEC24
MGAGGGRIVALHASLPNVGPGALKLRDDASAYNTEKEKTLLAPQNKFYADLALECAKRKVCVDLISCASVGSYIDLATLGQLPKVTGGGSIYIPAFQGDRHTEKLFYDLTRILTRRSGTDAIVKIRTSEGIAVDSFDGHFRTGGTGGGDIGAAGYFLSSNLHH